MIQPSTFEWAFFEGNAANTLRLSSSQKSNASPELRLSLILRRQFPGKSHIKLQYSLFLINGFCICGVIIQAWWMYFSLKFYDKTVSATVGGSFKPKFVESKNKSFVTRTPQFGKYQQVLTVVNGHILLSCNLGISLWITSSNVLSDLWIVKKKKAALLLSFSYSQ